MNDISIFDNRLYIVWNLKNQIRHCHLTVILVKVATSVLEKSWKCEKATDNISLSDFFLNDTDSLQTFTISIFQALYDLLDQNEYSGH